MRRIHAASILLAVLLLAGCDRSPTAPAADQAQTPATTAATEAEAAPAQTSNLPPQAGTFAGRASALPLLALSAEGLDLVDPRSGSIRHLSFGMPFEEVLELLGRVQGSTPVRSRNDECGAGPIDFAHWGDGLAALGQDGSFAGWSLAAGEASGGTSTAPTTVSGLGIGSTRSELESTQAIEVTSGSLGTEFAAGDLYGLLASDQPEARVTYLWAGVSCQFR